VTKRTYVVTGSASGIGRATCELLESQGHRVVDVDLHDASVCCDLGTPAGRDALVEEVRRASGGTVDAVVANAGVMADPVLCVHVNYFGAVATCEGLRPLLADSPDPRAVVTASSSLLNAHDAGVVEACLAGDEELAAKRAAPIGLAGYPTTKHAVARWVRREAPTAGWAGAGIGLNAVAPGIVLTPMTAPVMGHEKLRALAEEAVPMPYGGPAGPEDVAQVIAFLASAETRRVTGQVVFVDGGADVSLRGDAIW
jgi:NAD(P)-dependent dehydrogenase (short-subunit alcohol dehydrogenase family)